MPWCTRVPLRAPQMLLLCMTEQRCAYWTHEKIKKKNGSKSARIRAALVGCAGISYFSRPTHELSSLCWSKFRCGSDFHNRMRDVAETGPVWSGGGETDDKDNGRASTA